MGQPNSLRKWFAVFIIWISILALIYLVTDWEEVGQRFRVGANQ